MENSHRKTTLQKLQNLQKKRAPQFCQQILHTRQATKFQQFCSQSPQQLRGKILINKV